MKTKKPTTAQPHPGITMHRIRVGGDSMGFLAALAVVLVCAIGFPQGRGFLLASVVTGLAAALVFRFWFSRRPSDVDRLSIVATDTKVSQKPGDPAVESRDSMKTQNLSESFGVDLLRPGLAGV